MKERFTLKSFVVGLLFIPIMSGSLIDVIDDVGTAVKNGSSKEVAKYFDSTVDITILDQEGMYSKVQGEVILRDFFSKNPVQSFEYVHRGSSGEVSAYGIGKLKAGDKIYRFYVFVKEKSGQKVIKELSIEKEK